MIIPSSVAIMPTRAFSLSKLYTYLAVRRLITKSREVPNSRLDASMGRLCWEINACIINHIPRLVWYAIRSAFSHFDVYSTKPCFISFWYRNVQGRRQITRKALHWCLRMKIYENPDRKHTWVPIRSISLWFSFGCKIYSFQLVLGFCWRIIVQFMKQTWMQYLCVWCLDLIISYASHEYLPRQFQ